MNGRIHLKNMIFYGYHGHLAEEETLGQRFMIDLVLTTDFAEAARTDDLAATVDYSQVFALCREVVEKDRVKLLETLADHILERILGQFARVRAAEIIIRKPSVSLPGVLDYVAVEARKARA